VYPGRSDRQPLPAGPALPHGFVPALVAADLDGTLLDAEHRVVPGVPEALADLRTAGVPVVICTGRMFRSARTVATRLGIAEGPAVCYQGAMVADLASGEELRHVRMDGELAAEVVRHVAGLGRHLNAYIDDRLYVERVNEWARRYAEHVEVSIHTVADMAAEVVARPPTKLVLVTSAADVERVLPDLQARWDGRLYVTRSQAEYIEFVDGAVSKSATLDWLCTRLGRPREGVVALGDGMNDVDMIRWAGLGVAVAEAAAPVRAAADLVVPRGDLAALLRVLTAAARPTK